MPKKNSAEAPRSCKEASLISPKGSALRTWAAGPLMLPDSTTGLLNYFGPPSKAPTVQEYLDCVYQEDILVGGIGSDLRLSVRDRADTELILQRVHPDDVGVVKDILERATQGGHDFEFEHRLLMPDGSIKHIFNLAANL